jgi:cytochrome c-type biogenesis protein
MSQVATGENLGMKSQAKDGARPAVRERLVKAVSFIAPVGFVAAVLFVLVRLQFGAETAVASLAGWLPVGWAFGAGMVASVNPCGFMLLPSYLSYHLGTEEDSFYEQTVGRRLVKALALGGTATAGFVVILALFGGIIAAGGRWLVTVFPYAGVAIGGVMALLGLWLLVTRRTIGILAASRVTVTPQRNLRNVFSFGIAYAIGSLSCTLPIFLVVVGSSLASQGIADSLLQFVGYALGMGSILIAVTVGAALFRGAVAKLLRRVVPYVYRTSALFLVGAGAYLVYYWIFISGSFG